MPLPEFDTYLDSPTGPLVDLPPDLAAAHGPFTLPERVIYANFVASVDGIVAVPETPRSSALISGGDEGDRFLMALLRATADAVVIGAGTFRAHRGPWTADNAYPPAKEAFAELRRRLGLPAQPVLAVVTASGRLGGPPEKLRGGIVLTTRSTAADLSREVANDTEVVAVGDAPHLDVAAAMSVLADRGYRRILTEGGPALAGQLLDAGLIEELFLTLAPVFVGGGSAAPRPTLASGVDLVPGGLAHADLVGVRGRGSYLYLRYRMRGRSTPPSA